MKKTIEYEISQSELLEILENHFREKEGLGPKGSGNVITSPSFGTREEGGELTTIFSLNIFEADD